MDGPINPGSAPQLSSQLEGMTRRHLLRALAAGTSALAGLPLVAAVGGSAGAAAPRSRPRGQAVDVTLITTDSTGALPYPGLPTAEQQAADPGLKAYAEAIQPWLDENPGVKLEEITFDVYDQEALAGRHLRRHRAVVLSRPTCWRNGTRNWSWRRRSRARRRRDRSGRRRTTSKRSWPTTACRSGRPRRSTARHYALPYSYNCGDGIHYRIDLIKEAGLAGADRRLDLGGPARDGQGADHGRAARASRMQTWGLSLPLAAEGWGFRCCATGCRRRTRAGTGSGTTPPAREEWAEMIARLRAMIFQDQSVLADIAMEDDEIVAAVPPGNAAMMNNNVDLPHRSPAQLRDSAWPRTADELGKPIQEVFGYVAHPIGGNGFNVRPAGASSTRWRFNPDLDQTALDKAASLHIYMMGPGMRHPEASGLRGRPTTCATSGGAATSRRSTSRASSRASRAPRKRRGARRS